MLIYRFGCSGFNPRAHAGRDLIDSPPIRPGDEFQSTRPRGARPDAEAAKKAADVSIHAPTRGATVLDRIGEADIEFQSTRPRGARPSTRLRSVLATSFNPRAHAGRDHRVAPVERRERVSIHAPTRGATLLRVEWIKFHGFQSTRPRGARPRPRRARRRRSGFNPRAHAGRDADSAASAATQPVSIHAPTRGATQRIALSRCGRGVSIHAPTRGATSSARRRSTSETFQSTRPRGARRRRSSRSSRATRFQSTRPRGARPAGSRRRR